MKIPKLPDIAKALARLSKKEKLFFYIAAFVISLTLLDRLIISTIYFRMEAINKETKEKEASIKNTLHLLSQKNRILSESAKYAPFLSKVDFNEEQVPSLLKEIETLANNSSIYLIDIKPQGLKEVGTSKRYLVTLNCEAQMEQLIEFMYNIENSNSLFLIGKYQITPKSRESSVASCSMSIYKIIMQ